MNFGEFDVKKSYGNCDVIIYGAGVYGEYVFVALRKHGIMPKYFCDRAKWGGEYKGIKIISFAQLRELKTPYVLLLAVGAQYHEAKTFLLNQKLDFYDVYKLCFEDTQYVKEDLTEQTRDINYYRKLYSFGKRYYLKDDELSLFSVDWVITEKCSLRCKDCSNLMQYYKNPSNKNVQSLVRELVRLMTICDEIMDVRIIGGEPFMHPDLADIIRGGTKIKGINNFSIYTNATILPNPEIIELMKDERIKCEVSDYGDLSRNYDKFIEILVKNNIRYHIVKLDKWHKLGKLVNHNRSIDEMKRLFANCYCNDLITLLDGVLYRCPYSAHGRNLGAIPRDKNDCVDIYNDNIKGVAEEIRKLVFEKDYDLACDYCDGRNYHFASVEPALQIREPLEYIKCVETNGINWS